ncbi:MAG TPA: phosphatidate cytidylyltransferase [Thermodesulfovibrionales bacterium]|nr:phosphatidate cytidylyltransferase [Thermodesulfovibrionales bacterium]
MHATRLVVAVIVLPLFYLYVMKLHQIYFFVLILIVAAVAQAEFYAMYRVRGLLKASGLVGGLVLLAIMYFSRTAMTDGIISVFLIIAGMRLIGKRDPSQSLHDIAPVIIALLYIPCSLGFQLLLRSEGPAWILFLFGCVWASDSLAYYVGKGIGKRKLYVEVSPNKTVAGAFGSLSGGAAAGWLLNLLLIQTMGHAESLIVGLIIGATSIVGDLVESMFKRDAGVKDSSTLIPGHGGVIDKIDGVLFAGPVLYWVSRVFGFIA